MGEDKKEIFATVKEIHTYAPPNNDNEETKDILIGMTCFVESAENIEGLQTFHEVDLLLNISTYDFLLTFNKEEYKTIKLNLQKQIKKL